MTASYAVDGSATLPAATNYRKTKMPDDTLPAHTCHARGCSKHVKPELLFCYPHWKQVPRKIQLAVWKHYRPGQCDDKNPSEQWHIAADAAIGFIAQLEGHELRRSEKEALQAFGFDNEPKDL